MMCIVYSYSLLYPAVLDSCLAAHVSLLMLCFLRVDRDHSAFLCGVLHFVPRDLMRI